MKLAEGMKRIADGWVLKPKGFRVRFQQMTGGQWVTGYSPSMEEGSLDSDVTAWRYAWKLAMACRPGQEGEIMEGNLVNVTVVNDKGEPVVYYVTGQYEIFNPA